MSSWVSCTGLSPSWPAFPKTVPLPLTNQSCSPTPACTHGRSGSFPFARRDGGNRVFFLLLWLLRCFSSPGSPPYVMDCVLRHEVFSCGFPHSEISGSWDICSSPKLIAAYHVFHRLSVPRHPPCALFCLALSDTIALISDGFVAWFVSLSSLLSQRLVFVSIYVSRILRCFVYAVFKVQCSAFLRKQVEIKRFYFDPLLARQVLSQLSYIPICTFQFCSTLFSLSSGLKWTLPPRMISFKPMGLSGLEPPTSRLSGVRLRAEL